MLIKVLITAHLGRLTRPLFGHDPSDMAVLMSIGTDGPDPSSDEPTLTIVIPVYNELDTLRTALDRLLEVDMRLPTEVLVVDDGSTDGCLDTIKDLEEAGRVVVLRQPTNQGKGSALRRGIRGGQRRTAHGPRRGSRVRPRRLPEPPASRSSKAMRGSSTASAPTGAMPRTRSGS